MKTLYKARIQTKPLSVNRAYGRRGKKTFKSALYREYEEAWQLALLGCTVTVNPEDKLYIEYKWGFSRKDADVDNPIKPTQDIMQNWFGFNDKQVFIVKATKETLKRGEEYAEVHIQGWINESNN